MSEASLDLLADLVLAEHGADEPLDLLAMAPLLAEHRGDELRALREAASLATAAMLAPSTPPLPERLRLALEAGALTHCVTTGAVSLQDLAARRQAAPAAVGRRQPLLRLFALTALVAAAGLLLLLTWQRAPLGPELARAQLLATARPDLQLPWQAGPSPLAGTVRGDVVWSDAQQEGYLRFQGLPPLDQTRQFQLWIVDETRTGAPVDGGLFDLPPGATETVVKVQARLPVHRAKAFVVTVEARDGVVVSQQDHVVAIAGL